MAKTFRRIVTGHNAQGKSIFVSDGQSPATHNRAVLSEEAVTTRLPSGLNRAE